MNSLKINIGLIYIFGFLFSSQDLMKIKRLDETYSLTAEVSELRNSKGIVQFALYDKEGSIPDESFNKYLRKQTGRIVVDKAIVVFNNLPEGKYAIKIFHDENTNGKIDKGLVLPKEGIGFSNYQTIGLSNRPAFEKASFELNKDTTVKVKVIYL